MALAAGAVAPDFGLLATPDQKVALSEFKGPVVLIFYPADWSPVCSDELSVFSAASRLFHARNAQLLGISVDGPWCHEAFKEHPTSRSHFWRTTTPRVRSPRLTACTATTTIRRSVRSSSLTAIARWCGVKWRPSVSIPGAV